MLINLTLAFVSSYFLPLLLDSLKSFRRFAFSLCYQFDLHCSMFTALERLFSGLYVSRQEGCLSEDRFHKSLLRNLSMISMRTLIITSWTRMLLCTTAPLWAFSFCPLTKQSQTSYPLDFDRPPTESVTVHPKLCFVSTQKKDKRNFHTCLVHSEISQLLRFRKSKVHVMNMIENFF